MPPKKLSEDVRATMRPPEIETKSSTPLPLAATSQICKNCDGYFPKDAKKCPSCGTSVA